MFLRMLHKLVPSLSLTPNSQVGCRYPRNDRGRTMDLPGVRQRGRNSRIATRKWNSRTTMTNLPLLPRVSSGLRRLALNLHGHSSPNDTASHGPASLYEPATSSDRRRFIRPVPAVRSLLSIHPPSLCQPFLGSDTGGYNPCKSPHPQLPTPPVNRSK